MEVQRDCAALQYDARAASGAPLPGLCQQLSAQPAASRSIDRAGLCVPPDLENQIRAPAGLRSQAAGTRKKSRAHAAEVCSRL